MLYRHRQSLKVRQRNDDGNCCNAWRLLVQAIRQKLLNCEQAGRGMVWIAASPPITDVPARIPDDMVTKLQCDEVGIIARGQWQPLRTTGPDSAQQSRMVPKGVAKTGRVSQLCHIEGPERGIPS